MTTPIFAILIKSRPMSSMTDVSRSVQKVSLVSSGTGRPSGSNVMFAKVSFISFFKSSNGVSILKVRQLYTGRWEYENLHVFNFVFDLSNGRN